MKIFQMFVQNSITNRLQSRTRKPMTTRSKSKMTKKRKFDTGDDNDLDIDIVKPSDSNYNGEEPPKSRRKIG